MKLELDHSSPQYSTWWKYVLGIEDPRSFLGPGTTRYPEGYSFSLKPCYLQQYELRLVMSTLVLYTNTTTSHYIVCTIADDRSCSNNPSMFSEPNGLPRTSSNWL